MNEWIITVTLVSVLGYFIKIILPDGKNKNAVLFAVSLMSIIVIITPLSKISKSEFELNFNYDSSIEVDEAFLNYTENFREKYYLTVANARLSDHLELKNANFVFDDKISGNPLKKIIISFSDIVIKSNSEHINISLIIKERLSEQFSIKKECILINGIID